MSQHKHKATKTQKNVLPVIWGAIIFLIVLIACAMPVYSLALTGHLIPKFNAQTSQSASTQQIPPQNTEPRISKPDHKPPESVTTQSSSVLQTSNSTRIDLTDLVSFYETIITVLGFALALVAGLAVWSVRLISISKAEDIAVDVANRIIGDSKSFYKSVKKIIRKNTEEEFEEVRSGLEEIEKLNERLQMLERVIAARDEQESGDGTIEK